MATSEDFQENFFHCSICTERYTEPKVLRCQHTFCKACIHPHILQEVRKVPGRKGFPCPLCRSISEVNTSVSPDLWSSQLITNFPLINMMEALQNKDVTSKCETHGKLLEYLCRTHEKKVCSDCAVFEHRSCEIVKSAMTEKHETLLVDMSEKLVEMSVLEVKYSTIVETLKENKGKLEEKLREHFQNIRERLDTAEKDQLNLLNCKFECEMSAVEENSETCRNLIDKTQKVLEDFHAHKDRSSADIDLNIENLESLKVDLEECIKNMKQRKENMIALINDDHLDEIIEKMSVLLGEVIVNISTNEPTPTHECSSQVPGSTQPLIGAVYTGDQHDNPPPYYIAVKALPQGYTRNQGRALAYPTGIHHYTGGTQPILTYPHPTAPNTVNMMDSKQQPAPTPAAPVSVKLLTSFSTKRPTDKTHCWLTGAKYLANDNVALADRNNKKIKLFSSSFYCIMEVATQTYPYDLTENSTGEIAVTFPKQNRVSFFSVESLIPCTHYIDTEQPCLGISCGHEKLFVCCDTTWSRVGCIKVYDKYNQLLHKLEKDNNGKDMVSVTDYLTACPRTGNLFFKRGGFSKECIHCTTNQGTSIWKAKVPSWMDVPGGIAVLNNGVLVAIGSIKWVSQDGAKWTKLSESCDVEGPCALSINQARNKLLVTQADAISNCKENDMVKIFSINYA